MRAFHFLFATRQLIHTGEMVKVSERTTWKVKTNSRSSNKMLLMWNNQCPTISTSGTAQLVEPLNRLNRLNR